MSQITQCQFWFN